MGIGKRARQAAIVGLIVLAAAAFAAEEASPAGPDIFAQAIAGWAKQERIQRGFAVVRRDGQALGKWVLGKTDPDAPVHLASLSKAITAACVATLIRDGKLDFETPVAAALVRFIARYGKPRDQLLAGVTVAQLLTHRAGFATSDDDDPASGRNLDRYLKTHTSRAPPLPSLVAATLQAKLVHPPGARFAYGNATYLLLGAIIEEASGTPYLAYCSDAVLKPLGITADFEPAWQVSSSMGGWRMRGEDYLKFLGLLAADDERLGGRVKAWMLDPAAKSVPSDPTVWYGLGTYLRKAQRGVDIWHWGSWDYTPERGEKGTVATSFAAYAARLADGTAWFVRAEPRVEEGRPRQALVDRLLNAHRSATTAE